MLTVVLIYLAVGLLIGAGFAMRGVNRVDSAAADSPLVFRLMILPGCVGLWPIVLMKWIAAGKRGGG